MVLLSSHNARRGRAGLCCHMGSIIFVWAQRANDAVIPKVERPAANDPYLSELRGSEKKGIMGAFASVPVGKSQETPPKAMIVFYLKKSDACFFI